MKTFGYRALQNDTAIDWFTDLINSQDCQTYLNFPSNENRNLAKRVAVFIAVKTLQEKIYSFAKFFGFEDEDADFLLNNKTAFINFLPEFRQYIKTMLADEQWIQQWEEPEKIKKHLRNELKQITFLQQKYKLK